MATNSLRLYWRSSGSSHSHITELSSSRNNYTCTAAPGESSCDVGHVQCGDVYNVVVAPLTAEGSKVQFCAQRLYSGKWLHRYKVDVLRGSFQNLIYKYFIGINNQIFGFYCDKFSLHVLQIWFDRLWLNCFSFFYGVLVTCSGNNVGTGMFATTPPI